RRLHPHPFPIGQQVYADEVHVLRELGMLEPDVPALGCPDRLADGLANSIEVTLELLQWQIPSEHDFVTDKDPHDVQMGARQLDRLLELALVVLTLIIDPCA